MVQEEVVLVLLVVQLGTGASILVEMVVMVQHLQ
jgi:hypothetical protein